MQPITKIAVAILVVALLAVIGLIAISNNAGDEAPTTQETAQPAAEATAQPEATQEPEDGSEQPETDGAQQEALEDEAQDDVYEGALAGMTEEEIARQALAEEEGHGTDTND